jgi:hypothetical protein
MPLKAVYLKCILSERGVFPNNTLKLLKGSEILDDSDVVVSLDTNTSVELTVVAQPFDLWLVPATRNLSFEGFPLADKMKINMGRRSNNDIVVNFLQVSAAHCVLVARIDEEENAIVVEVEYMSRNGTFLNGQWLTPRLKHRMQAGDELGLMSRHDPNYCSVRLDLRTGHDVLLDYIRLPRSSGTDPQAERTRCLIEEEERERFALDCERVRWVEKQERENLSTCSMGQEEPRPNKRSIEEEEADRFASACKRVRLSEEDEHDNLSACSMSPEETQPNHLTKRMNVEEEMLQHAVACTRKRLSEEEERENLSACSTSLEETQPNHLTKRLNVEEDMVQHAVACTHGRLSEEEGLEHLSACSTSLDQTQPNHLTKRLNVGEEMVQHAVACTRGRLSEEEERENLSACSTSLEETQPSD